jgi:hypothetical protein
MQCLCVVVTLGTVVQTASVNIGMFLAGRVLAGYAVGLVFLPHDICREVLMRWTGAWWVQYPSIFLKFLRRDIGG